MPSRIREASPPILATESRIRSANRGADRWVSPFLLYHSVFTHAATQTKMEKIGEHVVGVRRVVVVPVTVAVDIAEVRGVARIHGASPVIRA